MPPWALRLSLMIWECAWLSVRFGALGQLTLETLASAKAEVLSRHSDKSVRLKVQPIFVLKGCRKHTWIGQAMENTPKITGVADVDLEAVESEETRAETIQSTGKSEIEGQIDHVEPEFVGVLIPPLLVFTLEWHWVYSVFIAYILSGLGLGIFEVTFLSVITPLGKATKSWAIIGCPAGFGTINILGLTLSILDAKWYIVACLPFGLYFFWKFSPREKTELRTANFGASLRQARRWMPGMAPFFLAQFLSHFAMENWPAIFYMFHPPKVPLFNPESSDYLMDWGQFFAITYIFIFLGDSISRRIAIYISTPSLRKRLALLGLAMGLIIAGLYLESLAIAIIIPLAIFMIFWGNGTIYGLTANHVDKQVPPEHNLASYSCWCFIGDLGAILGGILVENTHDLFCRGHHGPYEC
ncbi:unnamed protein product [Durusdinium trenchii]|uniref:Uncharacterized protein n=1 Tax=Durusdinium trenchii TaxID=1381693 RepID=A0ABP0JL63_9DINO